MAKKKAAKESGGERRAAKKNATSARQQGTIKAPDAPALLHSAEVGAPLAVDRAIAERLRLHPNATVKEIVAMFELDGVKVTAAAVKKVRGR